MSSSERDWHLEIKESGEMSEEVERIKEMLKELNQNIKMAKIGQTDMVGLERSMEILSNSVHILVNINVPNLSHHAECLWYSCNAMKEGLEEIVKEVSEKMTSQR